MTTRTIQYYDRKGILKPQGFTEGEASCVYRIANDKTLELILLLQDLVSALSDIDMLLKGEGYFEDTQYFTNYETTRN